MKEKIYTINGVATDKNNAIHTVTVVGLLRQSKQKKIMNIPCNVQSGKEETDIIQGKISYARKVTSKNFSVAYSICHPSDKFVKEMGIRKSTKRCKREPVYEISTDYFCALNDDMCNIIIDNELNYIIKNIDKYINK